MTEIAAPEFKISGTGDVQPPPSTRLRAEILKVGLFQWWHGESLPRPLGWEFGESVHVPHTLSSARMVNGLYLSELFEIWRNSLEAGSPSEGGN